MRGEQGRGVMGTPLELHEQNAWLSVRKVGLEMLTSNADAHPRKRSDAIRQRHCRDV
jgi:hypothetical protein